MAKKKRHRIWWFALFQDEYLELTKTRVLPVPMVLFDQQEMAYAAAYANRFDPLLDEQGNHVTVDDFAQLKDNGKIIVMGIHGSVIDWKRKVTTQRIENSPHESIYLEQPIKLDRKAVYKVLEESDEAYYRHLTSPMAKAGGIKVPDDLKERIEAKKKAAAAKAAEEMAKMKREANIDGENDGQASDAVATEVRDGQTES